MSRNFVIRAVLAGLVLVALAPAAVSAQPFDKRTYFSFSGPVSVPGVTLPAGKYLFRVSDTSRDVIQVLSGDGHQPYAQFFGRRVSRLEATKDPVVQFMETGAGMPAAVEVWWYPGELGGYQFVYPKEQARRLAAGIGQPVLTTVAETKTPPDTEAAELERISPSGEALPVAPPEPPAQIARGEVAPPEMMIEQRTELPKTASPLPIVAFAGLILLLGALTLRSLATRGE